MIPPEVGSTIRVIAYKGEPRDETGKVVSVRDTLHDLLKPTNKLRLCRTHSRYLITIAFQGEYRSFYTGFLRYEVINQKVSSWRSWFANIFG